MLGAHPGRRIRHAPDGADACCPERRASADGGIVMCPADVVLAGVDIQAWSLERTCSVRGGAGEEGHVLPPVGNEAKDVRRFIKEADEPDRLLRD